MLQMISQILCLFRVRDDNHTLAVAQAAALSKQIPLMYFILLVNTWGVATTHMQVAPIFLTIVAPCLMTIIGVMRIARWWRPNTRFERDPVRAVKDLRRTNHVAWVLAAVFAIWGTALVPYGDEFMQSHVAFYMGINVVGCIFCLTHLLPAALAVTLVVNFVFVTSFGLTGNEIFIAMAIDVGLVSFAMLMVLWVQYRDFTNLIMSRSELEDKQAVLKKRELDLIEEQKQTQALSDENKRLADIDGLTGLANRRFFFNALDRLVAQAGNDELHVHVGIIDLDGFKRINDVHGHQVGDDLLAQLATRLETLCQGDAMIARIGGDEFAFLLQSEDAELPVRLATELCAASREPFPVASNRFELSASVGFASARGADGARHLYEQADFALYQAKRHSPGAAVAFSADHHRSLSRLTIMEHAFRDGSFRGGISLEFQPVYDLERGSITAFEALARWRHPTLGPVSPAEFVPAAERLGYINQLSRLLLMKALQEAQTWPRNIRLSFNLSARDLFSCEHAMQLLAVIGESGVEPARIDLEITETALLTDLDRAQTIAAAFRNAGIGVSLDDFGTGYSSLTHLHAMPLTKIKIDRSFITEIDKNAPKAKIVKSLIRMAHDMNLECVIEGVETTDELNAVRDLGGNFVQGYYFSKPLRPEEARMLVAEVEVSNSLPQADG